MAISDEAQAAAVASETARGRKKDPAYRRALWIIVPLNIGFSTCEIMGGFISDSQALKVLTSAMERSRSRG